MKALLLIDIQNDFLPGGSLAVENGEEVVSVANRLMPKYDLVVATQDWHPANHRSFASQYSLWFRWIKNRYKIGDVLWPDHCVQGSFGAEFSSSLNTAGIHHVIKKGTDRNIDSYSGFFDNARRKATGLEKYLRENEVDEVHIVGLATDYCVKFTALDAASLGFKTTVIAEGTRGVNLNEGDCLKALDEMEANGIDVV